MTSLQVQKYQLCFKIQVNFPSKNHYFSPKKLIFSNQFLKNKNIRFSLITLLPFKNVFARSFNMFFISVTGVVSANVPTAYSAVTASTEDEDSRDYDFYD